MDISKILTETQTIPSYMVDFEQKITLPGLFSLLQDAAWDHVNRYGFGYAHLREKGLFWVLSKMKLIIYRYPCWTDRLTINTWGKEPELLTAYRDFEGWDHQRHLFFAATSAWHILSIATNRPQPMSDFKNNFPIAAEKHAIAEKPGKLPLPELLQQAPPQAVLPSDIDMHAHVNNTRYIQWAFDHFPYNFLQQHHLKEMEVNFLSQAKMGDHYLVATSAVSDTEFATQIRREEDEKELVRIKTSWKQITKPSPIS